MGLKSDLLDAITSAYVDANPQGDSSDLPDISDGSYAERLAHYQTEAIANFLTSCEFKITKLNAKVVLENFSIPSHEADIQSSVKVGSGIPTQGQAPGRTTQTGDLINTTNSADVLVKPIKISKDGTRNTKTGTNTGGLNSDGYVYIGRDPESQVFFDVEDEDGQRDFTTVKLFREDIEGLL